LSTNFGTREQICAAAFTCGREKKKGGTEGMKNKPKKEEKSLHPSAKKKREGAPKKVVSKR